MQKPKYLVVIAVACWVLLSIQACCKAKCLDQFMQLQFIGFENTDVDTFLVSLYEPNGQFNHRLDSSYQYLSYYQSDTISTSLSNPEIDLSKDIEIKLPGPSLVFRITDIQTKTTNCNCGPGSTKEPRNFSVNGVRKVDKSFVDLRK